MFEHKDVEGKYELVGGAIQHVAGLGAVDFSKLTLKEADYYFNRKHKALKLKNDTAKNAVVKPEATKPKA